MAFSIPPQGLAPALDAYSAKSGVHVGQGEAHDLCRALTQQDVLIERRAEGAHAGGRRFALGGFRMVDPGRLEALPDAAVVDWRRRGWLALIHHHLASLERFQGLLALEGGQAVDASSPVRPPVFPPAAANDGTSSV